MQEQTVKFKMNVSDENIKRAAMKVVWMFSGVTLVDINKIGILKVKGIFDKIEMRSKLQETDDSVVIITIETSHSRMIPPKVKFTIKIKEFNEGIKQATINSIWEFSGVTSVKVNGVDVQLEVEGDFDKIAMATKLKDIDYKLTQLDEVI